MLCCAVLPTLILKLDMSRLSFASRVCGQGVEGDDGLASSCQFSKQTERSLEYYHLGNHSISGNQLYTINESSRD